MRPWRPGTEVVEAIVNDRSTRGRSSARSTSIIARAGWPKNDVRPFLFERARQPVGRLKLGDIHGRNVHRNNLWPRWIDRDDDDCRVPIVRRPEDIHLIVAGGPGRHSVHLPGRGSRVTAAKVRVSREDTSF